MFCGDSSHVSLGITSTTTLSVFVRASWCSLALHSRGPVVEQARTFLTFTVLVDQTQWDLLTLTPTELTALFHAEWIFVAPDDRFEVFVPITNAAVTSLSYSICETVILVVEIALQLGGLCFTHFVPTCLAKEDMTCVLSTETARTGTVEGVVVESKVIAKEASLS